MNESHAPSRHTLLFVQLVLGLQQSGMMALGKLTNPITHKIDVQLSVARDVIDTLAMIEARTDGKLEPDEARVLRQALTDLRLNYVEELKKSSASQAPRDRDAGPEQSGGA